jgi:hypothetical protein
MRSFLIAGIFVLGFGGFVLLRGGTFTRHHDVLKVGEVKISADSRESIPTWLGWVAMLAGSALVMAGLRKSS